MAEGIVYLDVDDEITSAAQRIRSAPGTKVALVVPYGSRIATSRMNFRLLSREAVVSNRRLSIVSGDAAARSLAASAGLPVFGSVPEYEASLARPSVDAGTGEPPRDVTAAPAGALADPAALGGGLAASETVVAAGRPETGEADPGLSSVPPANPRGRKSQVPKRPPPETQPAPAVPAAAPEDVGAGWAADSTLGGRGRRPERHDTGDDTGPGGRNRAPLFAALGLVGLTIVVLAVGGYLFLPAATIALTPRREAIGPISLTVAADPAATEVDPINDVVPALRLDVPVQATRTFTTTGTKVTETKATGSVTFTNYDPTSSNTIASGSIVSTEGGLRFRTLTTLVVPHAAFTPPSTTVPSEADVRVQAVDPGLSGNVPANAIKVVPPGENPLFLAVANPGRTTGGTHTETPEVTKAEVDKAVVDVQGDLEAAFRQSVAAGAGAPPDTTLFPATAKLAAATPDVDPKTLIGQAVATFDIGLSAHGSVIAVDPRPVRTLAEDALTTSVAANHRLVEGSVVIDVGEGTVGEDDQVTFQATARAIQVAIVDADVLRGMLKGKTAAEARAVLVPYGEATVTLWPDWVSTITSLDARLSVTVAGGASGSEGGDPSPAPSPSPRRSSIPAGSSGASGLGSPSGNSSARPSSAP